MSGIITFHFDGPLVIEHRISLRTLGGTLLNLQGAIDRAHLDLKYGHVWKHARLSADDYPETEFVVGTPRDGGYILDLARQAGGSEIVRRVSSAVRGVIDAPFRDGANEMEHLAEQVITRAEALRAGVYPGRTLAAYIAEPHDEALRMYGDRAIAKEIDQILIPIRRGSEFGENQDNTLDLQFDFDGIAPTLFHFDRAVAKQFHATVSRRDLGEPLLYTGTLRSIDRGRRNQHPKAQLTLSNNERDVTLHIGSQAEYQQLAPFMQGNIIVEIYACPVLECNSFDPNSGDVYFLSLADF